MLSHTYMHDRPFPEKALELLDEACIYAKSHDTAQAVTKHSIQEVLQQKTHVPTELTEQ